MENKGKTTPNQPPIPRPVGFFYLYFPFVSSWLQVNYAKQTQFAKPQNPHNLFYPKDLHQYSAPSNEKKQSQNKPNPATPGKHRESSIQHQVSSPVYAKQTQFPKGQNQRNLLCHTDLPQYSTPPNPKKQSQTNPILAQYAIRNTQYEIRNTQYAIRDTKSIPCPLPPNPV